MLHLIPTYIHTHPNTHIHIYIYVQYYVTIKINLPYLEELSTRISTDFYNS